MLTAAKEETFSAPMVWTDECVLPLAAAGVYPKTRVWGSKLENVHCSSATPPLRIELRWGCEESSSKTAVGSGVSFKYDPFGRRIYKSSSSATSVYAYDGDNLIEETNSGGAAVARYSQTQNIDEPLAMLRSASTSYYEADGLGSITSLSSGAGALAQTYTFDSFGKQTNSSGSLTNSFQYTGRESDSETGLYYYRARYYDPSTGRFLSEDPLQGAGDGPNFYTYVLNKPASFVDPFGLNSGTATWPDILIYPIERVAPWVRPVGGAIGLFLGLTVGADATGIDDARAIPLSKTDPNPPCQKKGKWHCTASCHINNFSNRPNIPGFITGEGWGNSESDAKLAAEKNANENLSRLGTGIYKRHCKFKCEQR